MEQEKKLPGVLLDDELLEAVTGGTSLYEQARNMDKDSWFVSLVNRLRDSGEAKPTSTQLPLGTVFVGDYSEQRAPTRKL